MKMNKKIVVPFLSAVIGLSVSGGIGGAFAWYQYNSQVTASFIGTSVADSTVLQIGYKDGGNFVWGRDYIQPTADLIPVTFGVITSAPGSTAYGYPEAGVQNPNAYDSWSAVTANTSNPGFAQFDIYLRALRANAPIALDVYLSDLTIDDYDSNDDGKTQTISEAVRVHLNVENDTNRLLSKTTIDEAHKLPLFGPLDLDNDGVNDKKGGYAWGSDRDTEIVYGKDGDYQTTTGIADIEQARDGNGLMPATANAKKICTTKSTNLGTEADYVKITITIWLEGWAVINNGTANSNVWNPEYNAKGVQTRVGMTFDTGKVRGE